MYIIIYKRYRIAKAAHKLYTNKIIQRNRRSHRIVKLLIDTNGVAHTNKLNYTDTYLYKYIKFSLNIHGAMSLTIYICMCWFKFGIQIIRTQIYAEKKIMASIICTSKDNTIMQKWKHLIFAKCAKENSSLNQRSVAVAR